MRTSTTSLSPPTRYHPGRWEWRPSSSKSKQELTVRGIHLNPGKTVVLAPKRHVPTPGDISLLAGVGVRIADEGAIKVVEVPVGNVEFAIESAVDIV